MGLKCVEYLIDEVREVVHAREFSLKHKFARKYNFKVKPRDIHEGDLVLKEEFIPS